MRNALSGLIAAALSGCSADYELKRSDGAEAAWDTGSVDGDFGGAEPPADGDADEAKPEDERDRYRLRPAQTDVFVFIANPDRGTVTRVNVGTREVRTTPVGARPSVVAVTADYTTAVVFNQGDATVSIIDADTLDQRVVPVRPNQNALVLSPDGAWAVLWHDAAAETPDGPPAGGASSFNEVTLVDVVGARSVPLVVGFNPKSVRFTPDGRLALVVADASLAAIRLDAAQPTPEYVGIADPLDPPVAEEVVVSPSGRYAFVRQRASDEVTVVDLDTKEVQAIGVGQGPTDLDLTPDERKVVVVSRAARELTVLDIDDPFNAPVVVPFGVDEPLGSVLFVDDDTAILYTTTGATSRYATWDLATDDIRLRPLPKPIATIDRTETGGSLLVVHTRGDSPDGSTPEPYLGKDAVSLVDLGDFRANTIALQAEVSGFANSTDGRRGYLVMKDLPYLEVLDYTTLIHTELDLPSKPVFLGVLPDLAPEDGDEPPAWVSQQHPLGRLTFYDPDDGSKETLTGFELNAGIEE